MGDIISELTTVTSAFDKPTLKLLDRKHAPLALSVFRLSFPRDRQSVPSDHLHVQLTAYLDELRSRGHGDSVPDGNSRELCTTWMGQQWLRRSTTPDGEVYDLTSHTMEALEVVESLSRDRALLSESRIQTIVSAIARMADAANPDRDDRIRRLDASIVELTTERDRLAAGGELTSATDEDMVDGVDNVLSLVSDLPGDFARVGESLRAMHRTIHQDIRNEERTTDAILKAYLHRSDDLTHHTHEGRAFSGALALLSDGVLLSDLRDDLAVILGHPFAQALSPSEARDLRGAVDIMQAGTSSVLTQRGYLSRTLRAHLQRLQTGQDRELDNVLRRLNQTMATVMTTTGVRTQLPVDLLPEGVNAEHLRQRFYDPQDHLPAPPLRKMANDIDAGPDLGTLRQFGGPTFDTLREHLHDALSGSHDTPASLSDVFARLPPGLRRPVEVLGLLHVLEGIDGALAALTTPGRVETFPTVRHDGSTRTFTLHPHTRPAPPPAHPGTPDPTPEPLPRTERQQP